MIRSATRLVTTSAAMVLWATLAAAQQPAPISASHLALGREVAIGSGLTRSFDAIPSQLGEEIKKQTVTRPDLTKDLNDVLEKLRPEVEQQKQQMVTNAGRIFATRMTEQELKDVAAFFKTPAGQKYTQVQPLVLDDLVVEMQVWTQNMAEFVMSRVRAEMAKRGHEMQ